MAKQRKISQRQMLQRSLKLLSNLVATLSDDDMNNLLSGAATLSVVPSSDHQTGIPPQRTGRPEKHTSDPEYVIERLKLAKSVRDAHDILLQADLNKADLEYIARYIDVPVIKRDDVFRLEEKIVEALVGSRLNSQAVRGI